MGIQWLLLVCNILCLRRCRSVSYASPVRVAPVSVLSSVVFVVPEVHGILQLRHQVIV